MVNSEKTLVPWATLDSERVLDNPYMRIRRETVRLPSGRVYRDYFIHERRGWVAIYARTGDGRVLLNRQYKHGIKQVVLELPAGGLDPDEVPDAAARRELEEETGYRAETLRLLGKFILDPTGSDGYIYLFGADNVTPTGQKSADDREEIENVLMPETELPELIRTGMITVLSHIGLIHFALALNQDH